MLIHSIHCNFFLCFLDTSPSDISLTRKKNGNYIIIVVDRTEILTVMVMTL